jgi:hypothetical protein
MARDICAGDIVGVDLVVLSFVGLVEFFGNNAEYLISIRLNAVRKPGLSRWKAAALWSGMLTTCFRSKLSEAVGDQFDRIGASQHRPELLSICRRSRPPLCGRDG